MDNYLAAVLEQQAILAERSVEPEVLKRLSTELGNEYRRDGESADTIRRSTRAQENETQGYTGGSTQIAGDYRTESAVDWRENPSAEERNRAWPAAWTEWEERLGSPEAQREVDMEELSRYFERDARRYPE